MLHISTGYAYSQCFSCAEAPPGTIWCDDFEDGIPLASKYFEYSDNSGDFVVMQWIGRDSTNGIRVIWQAGEVSAGGMKKSFGRTPSAYIKKNSAYPDSTFNEIYWRMDVKSMEGWSGGGPAKLSRALCLANQDWATGMMAHLWSGGQNDLYLGMDPASGISKDGILMTTKYNDFDNMRWLGWKPGTTDIYSTANAGKWYCIEGHVRLNTPGISDGIFEFWVDDTLQAGSYNLNWHGDWNNNPENYKINAVFFENYWNSGSPKLQERYFDNIVISTERIGCKCKFGENSTKDEHSVGVIIYPNPANEILILESFTNSSFILYNIFGERTECKAVISGNNTILDIQSLARGVYILEIPTVGFRRFVKL